MHKKTLFYPNTIQKKKIIKFKKSFHFIFSNLFFFFIEFRSLFRVELRASIHVNNFSGAWWCLYQWLSSKLRVVLVMLRFLFFHRALKTNRQNVANSIPFSLSTEKATGTDVWTRRVGQPVKFMSISYIHKDFNRNGMNHDSNQSRPLQNMFESNEISNQCFVSWC